MGPIKPIISVIVLASGKPHKIVIIMKLKINIILNLDRLRANSAHYQEIKKLSLEIKGYFNLSKREHVKRVAMGNGGVGDLWRAVKIAKNINLDVIPPGLTLWGGGTNCNTRCPKCICKLF